MKNFIEVDGVEEDSVYAININHISKFYPVRESDKDVVNDFSKDSKMKALMIFADDDSKEKMNNMIEDINKANCIIELNILNILNKEDALVFTTNTYNEIVMKIENAQ